jgi:hypothetical protein
MKREELKEHLHNDISFTLFQEIILAHFDGRLHKIAMDYMKDAEKWEKVFEDKEKEKDSGKSFHLFHRKKK